MDNDLLNSALEQAIEEVTTQQLIIPSIIISISLIVVLITLRFILIYFVKGKDEILNHEKRRWINRINNVVSVIILIAILLIWAPQLHTFALSLTAVAVAVVLTTKELLMCLTGGFLRSWTKPFDVGDWITIDDVTGEVMTISPMAVKIQEIDVEGHSYQFTGKSIQIPNSKFLSSNVVNAEFNKNYIYHEITIVVPPINIDPHSFIQKLTAIGEKYFLPFREQAEGFNKKIEKITAIDFESTEPKVFMKTTAEGRFLFTVVLFIPAQQVRMISSNITCDFLSYLHKEKLQVEQINNDK